MSSYQNTIDKREDVEIDLIELVKMVFNHFKLVVIFVVVFSLFGLGFAFMQSEKHDITATVEIKTPTDYSSLNKYGIESYNASSVMNEMFSKELVEASIPETEDEVTYEGLMKVMSYSGISGTNYYRITVEKVGDKKIDFYTSLINNMVENTRKRIVEKYPESAEKGLALCLETYNSFLADADASSSSSSDYSSVLNSYITNRNSIQNYISIIPDALSFFQTPMPGDENKATSKAVVCIVAFLIGGVVGVITAIVIDFTDKRMYSSEKIMGFVADKLIASVPLYKDGNKIDENEFSYIESKLGGAYSRIIVTSLSDKAGKTTIAKGLGKETKAEVIDGESVVDNPDILAGGDEREALLVVLRAGKDTFTQFDKLITDLKGQNRPYYFVFNAVDVSDSNVTKYSADESYLKHVWLKESWRRFYKEHC